MKRILCYGDSNTYGLFKDKNGNRTRFEGRWTKLLKSNLGDEFEVVEEGLCSRTMFSFDEFRPFAVGFDYLLPCLYSHDKVDIVILMLGTNELKERQKNSAKTVFDMLKRYVKFLNEFESRIDGSHPRLIVCGVPDAKRDNLYAGASKKSHELDKLSMEFCKLNNIEYVSCLDLGLQQDGLHLSEQGHKTLAERLTKILK